MDLNHVLANCSDKEEIYTLTVSEIAEEQTKDKSLQQLKRTSEFEETLIWILNRAVLISTLSTN